MLLEEATCEDCRFVDSAVVPLRYMVENRCPTLKAFIVKSTDGDLMLMKSYSSANRRQWLKETRLLKLLKHPNVEEILYSGHLVELGTTEPFRIFSDFCPLTLHDFIHQGLLIVEEDGDYVETKVKAEAFILFQCLRGLAMIHSYKITHLNLTPKNILIYPQTKTTRVSGFSKVIEERNEEMLFKDQSNLAYRSIEGFFKSENLNNKADLWSVGCCFQELREGRQIFANEEDKYLKSISQFSEKRNGPLVDMNIFKSMQSSEFQQFLADESAYLDKISDKEDSLAFRLLSFAPENRSSAVDLLSHPYFDILLEMTTAPETEFYFETTLEESHLEGNLGKLLRPRSP